MLAYVREILFRSYVLFPSLDYLLELGECHPSCDGVALNVAGSHTGYAAWPRCPFDARHRTFEPKRPIHSLAFCEVRERGNRLNVQVVLPLSFAVRTCLPALLVDPLQVESQLLTPDVRAKIIGLLLIDEVHRLPS